MKIAVVDDSKDDAELLCKYISKFSKDKEVLLHTSVFYASFDFLEEYHGEYDVIFLDIEMPGSDGLEVAREIRRKDEAVGIVFVTGMAQYAIQGYEVNAIDFMVKPVKYYNFEVKLEKAINFCKKHSGHYILVNSKGGGIRKIEARDIVYIEKEEDYLVFHTKTSELRCRGSIKMMKEKLEQLPFAECISGCLVNLDYVGSIEKDFVTLEIHTNLPLSRRLKKQFLREYMKYVGGEF